jgi:hypothetical protein
MVTTAAQTTEPQFASLGRMLAFEFDRKGAEYVKAILTGLTEDGTQRREFLEEVACELKALSLHTLADMVREASRQCPSMIDLRFSCYSKPPYAGTRGNQNNIISWQRSQQRKSDRIHRECREILQRAGVDAAWISGETR